MAKTNQKAEKKATAKAPAKKAALKTTAPAPVEINIGDDVKYQLLDDEADSFGKEHGFIVNCKIKEPKKGGFYLLEGNIRNGQTWHRSAQYASELTPGYFTK